MLGTTATCDAALYHLPRTVVVPPAPPNEYYLLIMENLLAIKSRAHATAHKLQIYSFPQIQRRRMSHAEDQRVDFSLEEKINFAKEFKSNFSRLIFDEQAPRR